MKVLYEPTSNLRFKLKSLFHKHICTSFLLSIFVERIFHVKDSHCFLSLEAKGEHLFYHLVFLGLEILDEIQRRTELLWQIYLNQVP